MKLYTMSEVAKRAGVGIDHVRSCYKWEVLGGQRVAGTYVSTQEQLDSWLQSKSPPRDQPVLHSVLTGAKKAGVSTRQVRKAIENDTLPTIKIATPGRHGWAYVFTEDDLNKANLNPDRPGPIPKGAADTYITEKGDRFVVTGTHNRKGLPYSYKRLAVARRRAREAYDNGLAREPGTEEIINWDGGARSATIIEGVTNIDQTMIVSVGGEKRIVPRSCLRELKLK